MNESIKLAINTCVWNPFFQRILLAPSLKGGHISPPIVIICWPFLPLAEPQLSTNDPHILPKASSTYLTWIPRPFQGQPPSFLLSIPSLLNPAHPSGAFGSSRHFHASLGHHPYCVAAPQYQEVWCLCGSKRRQSSTALFASVLEGVVSRKSSLGI